MRVLSAVVVQLGSDRSSLVVPWFGKAGSDVSYSVDGQSVHLYKDGSTSGLVVQRRKLRCVLVALDGVARHGISLARSLELGAQWDAVVRAGSCGPFCWGDVAISPDFGLSVYGRCVRVPYNSSNTLLHDVVGHRGDVSVRCWRFWIWEDPLLHPYPWLRPDLPPSFVVTTV